MRLRVVTSPASTRLSRGRSAHSSSDSSSTYHNLLFQPLRPRFAMSTRQAGPGPSAASDGSRTITVQDNQPREESHSDTDSTPVGTLRLRGARRNRPRVVWREDVVDNEGAGKKKSKSEHVCPRMPRCPLHTFPFCPNLCPRSTSDSRSSLLHIPQAEEFRRVVVLRLERL